MGFVAASGCMVFVKLLAEKRVLIAAPCGAYHGMPMSGQTPVCFVDWNAGRKMLLSRHFSVWSMFFSSSPGGQQVS